MEKKISTELMQEVLKLSAQLNVIIKKIQEITPESDRKAFDSHMGPMMAACEEHIFRPILKHYPESNPHN